MMAGRTVTKKSAKTCTKNERQRSLRFDGRREELTLYCKSATEFPRFKKVRETQRPMEM